MSNDPLLKRIDDLVSLVGYFSNEKQDLQKDTDNVDEKKQQKHDCNTIMCEESLTLSNENGRYVYNRFGYNQWTKVAYALEAQYGLHELKTEENTTGKKSKKKKKRRYPKCAVTASGMNAISAVFHGILLKHQQESINIIYSNELYDDTPKLMKYFANFYNKNINLIQINDICSNKELTEIFQSDTIKNTDTNVLFFETCSNPNGYIMDFKLIGILRANSRQNCYVIMDNTWLTSIIFNPFQFGADFVVISLSKYYSGGNCIGGAVLHHGKTKENMELMGIITNWIRINGIHISPFHCNLIINALPKMEQRIRKTSTITVKCAEFMHTQIGNCLMDVNHVSLNRHVSNELYMKYIHKELYPSVISFKVKTNKMTKLRKWLASSKQLLAKTSFGGKDSRFDTWPYRDDDGIGIWCRFSIGYNDSFETIKAELKDMINKLTPLCT
eukprot:537406_1